MATNLATILVELRTNTKGFSQQIDNGKKKLTQFRKKTDEVNKKTVKGQSRIQDQFKKTSQSIAAVQGPLGPIAGRITSLGAIIGNVGLKTALITVGIAALTFALKAMVGVVGRAEQQFLKLEAILKATGGAAGLSMMEIENLSRSIGIETLASTQKVRDAAGILLTFKSVQGDVFKDALRLTQDLAEIGFGDLKTGATQLGKALEEPIVGLGALRRVGVSFTEAQKEQIKVLDLTGRRVEAQEIILKALNEQVGGAGVNAAQGLSGAIDSVKEKFALFFEQTIVGRFIVDKLTAALLRLSDWFGDFDKSADQLKTFEELSTNIKKIKAEIETLDTSIDPTMQLGGYTKDQQRLKELEKQLADTMKQQANLIEQDERAFHRKTEENKTLKEELTALDVIANKNAKKRQLNHDREIEDLGKTKKELRAINEVRKIEDALLAKMASMSDIAKAAAITTAAKQKEAVQEQNELLFEQINLQEKLDKAATSVGQQFQSVGEKISDAMARGKLASLDFVDILHEMIIAIQKMIFKIMVLDEIQKKIEERMKKGGDGGGFLGTVMESIFGKRPKKAGGGTVQQGTPTVVGERGPELFVPNAAGSIKNNADTKSSLSGGSGVSIVQNLNFAVGVTNTVRAEVMNMLPAIQQSTLSAVADAKQRGGKFSKAFGG